MQQFVVPQFIDVEDKVLGPIAVRQFITILLGSGVMFLEYKLADFSLFIFEGIITLAIVITIAFLKINGRPVHYFILNFLQTMKRPRLRVWDKTLKLSELKISLQQTKKEVPETISTIRIIGSSKLAELALIVDTGGVYQGENLSTDKNLNNKK
ncbi:PrgI family protein [Patescibacteria group bacterium]|nr:PrgI family protein [Patescibacteria group bacterium]